MTSFDITVIGLGVHGSAVAGALAMAGLRVLALEQAPDGQVWGASQGPFRMVRVHDPHRPELTDMAVESISQWEALAPTSVTPILRRVAGVFLRHGPDCDDAPSHPWRRHVAVDDPVLAGLIVEPGWKVTRDERCGLLDASAGVRALRAAARAYGAELVFGHMVSLDDVRRPDSLVHLRVAGRRVTTSRVLFCVGAWHSGLPHWARLSGMRVQSAHMQVAALRGASPLSRAEAFYVFHTDHDRFCVIPHSSGGGVQFGHLSSPSPVGGMAELDQFHATRRRDFNALRRLVPDLGAVLACTTVRASYCIPPDGAFVIRFASRRIATLVACSGIGFKFAPAVAQRVVAVLRGEKVPPAELRVEFAQPDNC